MTTEPEDSLRRREMMAVMASLAALAAFPAEAQTPAPPAPLDRTAFMQASSAVTGMPVGDLTALGDILMTVFRAQGPAIAQLAALAATTPPEAIPAAIKGTPLELAAKALAAAWYTGTVGFGPNARLVSYDDALCWKAAGFAAAPGACVGEFGSWANPPA